MTRYTVNFTDRPGSKARYRHALKLLGAEHVRITETADAVAAPQRAADNLPTSPEALALARLYKRAPDRPWSEKEIALFRAARKRGVLTPENMQMITRYYEAERKKCREGIYRRDLATFLGHCDGELDRARAFAENGSSGHSKALEWLPCKVVPMPQSDEERERIRVAALATAAAFREGRQG